MAHIMCISSKIGAPLDPKSIVLVIEAHQFLNPPAMGLRIRVSSWGSGEELGIVLRGCC